MHDVLFPISLLFVPLPRPEMYLERLLLLQELACKCIQQWFLSMIKGSFIIKNLYISLLNILEALKLTCCCSKCNIIIIIVVTLGRSVSAIFCGEVKFNLFALLGILSSVGTVELVYLKESKRILCAECDTETSSSLPQDEQQCSRHDFGNLLWFFLFLHFPPFLPSSIFFKGLMTWKN